MKSLPQHAALVTFDDGFMGSFYRGLPICRQNNIKPIYFLNFGDIFENKVLWPAVIDFLASKNQKFKTEIMTKKIKKPEFLHVHPESIKKLQKKYNIKGKLNSIKTNCGLLISSRHLKEIDSDAYYLGNHLYFHWPSSLLNKNELIKNALKNHEKLRTFKNSLKILSFPFGDLPKSLSIAEFCERIGYKKCFGSQNGVNPNPSNTFLGRVSLGENDQGEFLRWFRLGRNFFAKS